MTPLAPEENAQRNNARGCGIVVQTNLVLSSPPKMISDGWKHMVSIAQGWKSLLLSSPHDQFELFGAVAGGEKLSPLPRSLLCQSLLRNFVPQPTNAPIRHNCGGAGSSGEILGHELQHHNRNEYHLWQSSFAL